MDSISNCGLVDSTDVLLRPMEVPDLQEDGRNGSVLPGFSTAWEGMKKKECHICVIEHSEELHNAVLGVREWLREKVTLSLTPVDIGPKRKRVEEEFGSL